MQEEITEEITEAAETVRCTYCFSQVGREALRKPVAEVVYCVGSGLHFTSQAETCACADPVQCSRKMWKLEGETEACPRGALDVIASRQRAPDVRDLWETGAE